MKIETTNTPNGTPAISSLEIARITGKNHRHVLGDIRRILSEVGIDTPGFGHISKDLYGRELFCFLLPKRECHLIISGYSATHRLALIDRLEELEERMKTPPLTDTQEALGKVLALFEATELAMILKAFAPECAPQLGLGIRRGCYVRRKSRMEEAERIWDQRAAVKALTDALNGQLRLAL
jgi:phage regulator Rha-like protein